MYDGFSFDTFFDLPDSSLPRHCEYYFNVLVINAAVPQGTLRELTGENIDNYEDISRIKDARPIYLYVYEDEDITEPEVEYNPHSVVEVNTKTFEVSWYDMIDFETERPWAIEPVEENFDYDDEE